MNYFQALANFDAQQRALQAEIEELRDENAKLQILLQERLTEISDLRQQNAALLRDRSAK